MFSSLRKGDICIDCGANRGDVTQKMVERGATVYAFEPNPHVFEILEKRFAGQENVHCIRKGVLDRDAKVRLFMHENSDEDEVYWSQGTSMLDFKGNINKDKFVEIEAVDLAGFIEGLGRRVKLLKMDVEGVEYETLERLIMTGVIDRIDRVVVETHEKKIPELLPKHEALLELMKRKSVRNVSLNWI